MPVNLHISQNSMKYSLVTSSITYVILSNTIDTSGKVVFNGIFIITYLTGSSISYVFGTNICSTLLQNIYLMNVFVKPKFDMTKLYLSAIPSVVVGGVTMLLVSGAEISYFYFHKLLYRYISNEKIDDDYEIV